MIFYFCSLWPGVRVGLLQGVSVPCRQKMTSCDMSLVVVAVVAGVSAAGASAAGASATPDGAADGAAAAATGLASILPLPPTA